MVTGRFYAFAEGKAVKVEKVLPLYCVDMNFFIVFWQFMDSRVLRF